MTDPLYDDLANVANDLIGQFGKSATYKRTVNGAYDPATGAISKTTTTSTITAFAYEYTDREVLASGGRILKRDRKCLVAGLAISFEPDPTTDTLTIDGVEYAVVYADKPVGEDVLHIIQLREAQ